MQNQSFTFYGVVDGREYRCTDDFFINGSPKFCEYFGKRGWRRLKNLDMLHRIGGMVRVQLSSNP